MAIQQISVFVENKPGRLAEITEILKNADIDIRALSIADTTNFGILRLIVNDPELAYKSIKESGFTVSLTEVIAVRVADQPGGLSDVLNFLASEGMDVEYMYAFVGRDESFADVIMRVENNAKANEILQKHGVSILKPADIYKI